MLFYFYIKVLSFYSKKTNTFLEILKIISEYCRQTCLLQQTMIKITTIEQYQRFTYMYIYIYIERERERKRERGRQTDRQTERQREIDGK